MNFTAGQAKKYFLVIFVLGVLARCYGITDHWKNNDHYNFGGSMMTHALKCLRSAPLEVSRGLIITECDTDKPNIYANYTPFFLWGMWLTTEAFGNGEWAHRLFFLIFSCLNIWLVFWIAKEVWPQTPRLWVFAAFFQSFFLSPMYLATHMDPITEFTVTPMLLSSLAALRGRMLRACLWALIAGLTTWIGYFQFLPLLLFSWVKKKDFALVLSACVASACICLGSLMYLRETWDILGFVGQKLTDPEYIRPPSLAEKLLLPVQFIRNFFQSLSRLLGPLFASFALYEFFFGAGKNLWRFSQVRKLEKIQWAFVLTGMAFFGYLVPGFKYAMVHIHNYIFAVPMWALLCASFVNGLIEKRKVSTRFSRAFSALVLIFLVSYPYGIYQSSLAHDIANSVLFVAASLIFLFFFIKSQLRVQIIAGTIAATAIANFSQVVNYRNEKDTEFPFCEWARKEFEKTGQPIHTQEPRTRTKVYLYCRGIPIEFDGPEKEI